MSDSNAGKSENLIRLMLDARGRFDPRTQPLLAEYAEAIIDAHGAKAQELLEKLADLPDGQVLFDDLNKLRMQFGFDPLRRSTTDDDTAAPT
jgi:hypothetical protein